MLLKFDIETCGGLFSFEVGRDEGFEDKKLELPSIDKGGENDDWEGKERGDEAGVEGRGGGEG